MRFHVRESLVACSKAHKLHASDTPLKNASVVGTRVSASGLREGKFRISLVSDGSVCKLPDLDTRGRDWRQQGRLDAHVSNWNQQSVPSATKRLHN